LSYVKDVCFFYLLHLDISEVLECRAEQGRVDSELRMFTRKVYFNVQYFKSGSDVQILDKKL